MIKVASIQLTLKPSFTNFMTFPPDPYSNCTDEILVFPLALGSGSGSVGVVMLNIPKEYVVGNEGDQNYSKLSESGNGKTEFVLSWQDENLFNDLGGLTISPRGDFLFGAGGPLDRRLMVFAQFEEKVQRTCSTELRSGAGPCSFHPGKPLAACHCYPPFGRREDVLSGEQKECVQYEFIRFFPLDEKTGRLGLSHESDEISSSFNYDDPVPPPISVTYEVNDIRWSPDGTLLAIAEGEVDDGFAGTNGIIRVFRRSVREAGIPEALSRKEEAGPWECIYYKHFSQVVSRVVFSHDGTRIAFTYADKIRIVDLSTGDTLGTKRGVWPGALSFFGSRDFGEAVDGSGRNDAAEEILFASEHRLTSIRVKDLEEVFSETLEGRIEVLEVLPGTRLILVLFSNGRLSLYEV